MVGPAILGRINEDYGEIDLTDQDIIDWMPNSPEAEFLKLKKFTEDIEKKYPPIKGEKLPKIVSQSECIASHTRSKLKLI